MSRYILNEGAAPSTPATGKVAIWADVNGVVQAIDDTGRIYPLGEDVGAANMLTNGEFDYAQRQPPGTLTTYSQTAARIYGADRWALTNENASSQYIRTDTATTPQTGLLSRFFGTYSKITTTGKIEISQALEAGNCLHLRGRTVRIQVKMKASSAKTMRIVLLQLANAGTIDSIPGYAAGVPSGTFISAHGANSTDPTFGTNLAKIAPVLTDNATIANTGLSCSVTTAWQRFGGTFLLPTDFKNLVVCVFTDSQFAAADSFGISEAGIYDGPEIRDWSPRHQALQLATCQRYFTKSFAIDTAPIQNGGVLGCISAIAGKAGAVALAGKVWVNFPVVMRILPLVVGFCPTEASAHVDRIDGTTPIAHTATAQLHLSENGLLFTSTGTTNTAVGDTIAIHYTADAEL